MNTILEERRKEIFAKEILTIADLEKLMGMSYQMAARFMREIKRKSDRLGIRGKCHVQDYIDAYALDAKRYGGTYEKQL